jgi:transposase-like protein
MARRRRRKAQDAPRNVGRPAKRIDLTVVRARLAHMSLRSVARSLMVSHSTLLAHLKRAGLVTGLDATRETSNGN